MNALVTGGSRGLGYHVAAGLRAAGLGVAIIARDGSALDEAAREIGALAVAADVTSPLAVERAVGQLAPTPPTARAKPAFTGSAKPSRNN